MRPVQGETAPGLRLHNTFKKETDLNDLRGSNVLLLFFPLAFTSTCTTELCGIRDNLSQYEGLNAQVFGISCDSVYALAKFREEQRLQFDLLSDFNRDASRAYGCLYEKFSLGMKDVPKRAAFVIDSRGILQYAEILENAGMLPDFEKIISCLKGLNNA